MTSPLILYLDQSRVSEMIHVRLDSDAGGIHRTDYEALYPRLLTLVDRGNVVCPFSLWHAIESVQFDDDAVRMGVCEFFDRASCNRSFRFFEDVFKAELDTLANGTSIGPLGDSLDCFPHGAITPLTREVVGSARAFTTIVESLRMDPSIETGAVEARDGMLEAIRGYVERYHGVFDADDRARPSVPAVSVIRSAFAQDVLDMYVRDLVAAGMTDEAAKRVLRIASDAIDESKWGKGRIANLGAWIETTASRIHRGGKVDSHPKRRGEAFDLCHMASLGSADVFLMEKKFTAIGENAARVCGTRLVHAPSDLLAELAGLPA